MTELTTGTVTAIDAPQLPVEKRAKLALVAALKSDATEGQLQLLAAEAATITAVIDPDGRAQAYQQYVELKEKRLLIGKRGKEARDDANKLAKLIIETEKTFVDIVKPQEERLLGLINAYDAAESLRIEEEKRKAAEREKSIIDGLDKIADLHARCVTSKSPAEMAKLIAELQQLQITEDVFYESMQFAKAAKDSNLLPMIAAHEIAERAETAEKERLRLLEVERTQREQEIVRLADENKRMAQELADMRAAMALRDAPPVQSITGNGNFQAGGALNVVPDPVPETYGRALEASDNPAISAIIDQAVLQAVVTEVVQDCAGIDQYAGRPEFVEAMPLTVSAETLEIVRKHLLNTWQEFVHLCIDHEVRSEVIYSELGGDTE